MALEDTVISLLETFAGMGIFAYILTAVIVRFLRREQKGQQIKDYFQSIGIKNLRIKDFEGLSDDALRKALTFFTTMHQATRANPMADMMGQMQMMAALAKSGPGGLGAGYGVPTTGQPTTP